MTEGDTPSNIDRSEHDPIGFGPPPQAAAPSPPVRQTTLVVGAVVAVVALVVGIVVVVTRSGSDATTGPDASGAGASLIYLEPANGGGHDPFIPAVAPTATPVEPDPPAVPTDEQVVALQAVRGTEVGLYGGQRGVASCVVTDIGLAVHASAVASKWATAQGIEAGQVDAFLATLTPVVLLRDLRATSSALDGGELVGRQVVLEAGTAVLIDRTGLPRARCLGATPLNRPLARAEGIRYSGTAWAGFDPGGLQVISAGESAERFVLQALDGRQPFTRPAGTSGESDSDAPQAAIDAIRPEIRLGPDLATLSDGDVAPTAADTT